MITTRGAEKIEVEDEIKKKKMTKKILKSFKSLNDI